MLAPMQGLTNRASINGVCPGNQGSDTEGAGTAGIGCS